MNLLHGDHTAAVIVEERAVAAECASHNFGTPHTILVKGWACDLYSLHTIEFSGATMSAE